MAPITVSRRKRVPKKSQSLHNYPEAIEAIRNELTCICSLVARLSFALCVCMCVCVCVYVYVL